MVHIVKFLECNKGFITFYITQIDFEFSVFREDETEVDKEVSAFVLRYYLSSQLNIFFI